jgi:hypothetical protein
MASYNDPQTGEHRRVDIVGMERTTSIWSWVIVVLLIAGVAFAAWFFYERMSPTAIATAAKTGTTQSAPEPYPVSPTPPSPSATVTPPKQQAAPPNGGQ